ncbi:50S ribosomal protein-like protein [Actinidia rufa]|uniref:50S ribosomal protein-like protein n=1 Tax=Actinidia rufa TaxID=165716 RepID=A0A7J0EEA8_9ERIC|nr:50S ribosomal protein-like protein [Actinidia rufa]
MYFHLSGQFEKNTTRVWQRVQDAKPSEAIAAGTWPITVSAIAVRRVAPPHRPQPSARKTPSPTSLPFSVALSSSGGGGDSDDETNKSFSLWLTAKSLFFFSGESAEEGGSGESSEWGNRLSPPAVAAEQHP